MLQGAEESGFMAESLPDASATAPSKPSTRSFKKKFAKLKVKFEVQMRESESLIREELRIQDLSKRIQEQNDQLLEVLMEFNDSLHVPQSIRYDLSAPDDESFLPTPEREFSPTDNDPSVANYRLKKGKSELEAGVRSVDSYRELEDAVRRGKAFTPQNQYSSLIRVPHTALQTETQDSLSESTIAQTLGYFTPEHETEYYLAMDAKLGDESAALQLSRAPEKVSFIEREREAALRNPISVYNWLRRNQPHIFLQDNENASEKSGSRPSNSRSTKKAPAQRKDEDTHDDDGSAVDTGPTAGGSKNKRKREEDAGQKPKGGSSRANRKKKEDGPANTKRASKGSTAEGV